MSWGSSAMNILGGFNAKVGNQKVSDVTDGYVLAENNDPVDK